MRGEVAHERQGQSPRGGEGPGQVSGVRAPVGRLPAVRDHAAPAAIQPVEDQRRVLGLGAGREQDGVGRRQAAPLPRAVRVAGSDEIEGVLRPLVTIVQREAAPVQAGEVEPRLEQVKGRARGQDGVRPDSAQRPPGGAEGGQRGDDAAVYAREPRMARAEPRRRHALHADRVRQAVEQVLSSGVGRRLGPARDDDDVPAQRGPVPGEGQRAIGAPVDDRGEVPGEQEQRPARPGLRPGPPAEAGGQRRPAPPSVRRESADGGPREAVRVFPCPLSGLVRFPEAKAAPAQPGKRVHDMLSTRLGLGTISVAIPRRWRAS